MDERTVVGLSSARSANICVGYKGLWWFFFTLKIPAVFSFRQRTWLVDCAGEKWNNDYW